MILGIRGIEESSVYQSIFAKGRAEGEAKGRAEGRAEGEAKGRAEGEASGRAEEARQTLLNLGSKKLGQPDPRIEATLAAIADVDRLNALLERLLDVSNWDDLLVGASTNHPA